MNKLLLAGAAGVAALTAVAAVAQSPAPAAPRAAQTRAEVTQHVQAMFTRVDANHDDWLTKAEADAAREQWRERAGMRAGRGPEHTFEQLDTDRNGSISRAEFDAVHAQHADRKADRKADRRAMRHDGMGKGGMRGGHMMGGAMFEMSDSNKDGKVSLQEATAAALQHFDMADANRDGQITRDERTQMRKKMRADRRPG